MDGTPLWFPLADPWERARAAPDTEQGKLEAFREFVEIETARRALLAHDYETDPGIRKALDDVYRNDGVRWCNDWVWVENQHLQAHGFPSVLPFYLFDDSCIPEAKRADPLYVSQAGLWQAWDDIYRQGGERFDLKSRKLGISYLMVAYAWHKLCYREGAALIFVSMTQKDVDKLGDPDTPMEKVRIVGRRLPAAMTGGWDENNEQHNKLGLISHPKTGSRIKAAWGPQAGRQGRAGWMFFDESEFNAAARAATQAASETARARIHISTANGPANYMAQEYTRADKPRSFCHWAQHPFRDSAYGARYEAINGSIARASELEGDHAGSVVGAVIPNEWLQAAIQWKPSHNDWSVRVVGYDIADDGDDNAVRAARVGPSIVDIEADPNEKPRDGHARLQVMVTQYKASRAVYDAGGGYAGTLVSYHADQVEQAEDNGGDAPAYEIIPCKGSRKPPKRLTFDDDDTPVAERFANMRAVYWWNLRERCRKTWELANGVRDWPEDECADLPDLTVLREELLMPRIIRRGSKIAVSPKKDMPRSTDYGDAVCYAFADFLEPEQTPSVARIKAKPELVQDIAARRRALAQQLREARAR